MQAEEGDRVLRGGSAHASRRPPWDGETAGVSVFNSGQKRPAGGHGGEGNTGANFIHNQEGAGNKESVGKVVKSGKRNREE